MISGWDHERDRQRLDQKLIQRRGSDQVCVCLLGRDPPPKHHPTRNTRLLMSHQFTLNRLMVLLGISVVLAACSTVSRRPPVGDPSTDVHGSTDQKRDSNPDSSQTEMPQQPQSVLSHEAESRRGLRVVEIARKHVGTPYRWRGTSPSGFDCSGLVRYVYAQVGVTLPHNAAKQYRYGMPISRDRLQPGDLVFFDRLRHNGIYVGSGRFIHARQTGKRVSISSLDEDWYAQRWVGARRL
jgi:NlpC/P60 family